MHRDYSLSLFWGRGRDEYKGKDLGRESTIETKWFVSMVLFTTLYDRFMSSVVSKRLTPSV